MPLCPWKDKYEAIDAHYVGVTAQHIEELKARYEKVIVLNGYPKSGNSWLCRIVGHYLDCAVIGYLGAPAAHEISAQDAQGNTVIGILKSHHVPDQLARLDPEFVRVLHIVRDPRDVCVSAAAYFNRKLFKFRFFHVFLFIKEARKLWKNDAEKPTWWSTGWSGYYAPLTQAGTHIVRYEDLLENKQDALLDFFEAHFDQRDPQKLSAAMTANSFSAMKKKADKMGATFLRAGKSGGYQDVMPKFLIRFIDRKTRKVRESFNYKTDL